MAKIEFIEGCDAGDIANWLEERLLGIVRKLGKPITICVPGGSTPFPILDELVDRELDFSLLEVWPNDDRIVPEDHEASNTGKIRGLLEPTGVRVVALTPEARPPEFDLVWLGMGADGHIASLFPNTDPQPDDPQMVRRLTPDPLPPNAPFDRITLTLPALLRTDAILFTLGGSDEKRAVFDAAMAGEHDLPIARLLEAASARSIPVTCFT